MLIHCTRGVVLQVRTLTGHSYRDNEDILDGVTSVAFAPDGQRVVSACTNELKIWDTATGADVSSSTWLR